LLLKLLVSILTRATEPKFIKENRNKKLGELEKVEKMMQEQLDIKKSEEENNEKLLKGPYKYFSKLNDLLCVEFFCNFLMAIQLDVLLGVFLAI
jgi:hypothetical protein